MKRPESKPMLVRSLAALLCVLSLLLSAVPVGAESKGSAGVRMYPSLATMAVENPGETARVIVQGNNPSGRLAATVEQLGGKVKKPLALVKGIAADIPAGKLITLANDPDVRYISLDAPMIPTVAPDGGKAKDPKPAKFATGSARVPGIQSGSGIGVAVLDSGINDNGLTRKEDFGNRVIASVSMTRGSDQDGFGHGTHVAGVIASSGEGSDGAYTGAAPNAQLISVKVSDDQGVAYISDVIDGLQWVLLNRERFNIRVANISLLSTVPESYLTSPLDAAVELLWLSGITVVVSAGNDGANSMQYPPANDPFVITVGATDDNATPGDFSDDLIPSWSSFGTTQEGFAKPDILASGRRVVSDLAQNNCVLAQVFPDRIVDKNYIRLSGTSVAAPAVSGVAALAFEAHPDWTPDQFKSALVVKGAPIGAAPGSGFKQVDAGAILASGTPDKANNGIPLNKGVADVAGVTEYNSATWNSATWNSATWNSATWNSATWNSATWNSATWNSATWNSATWNSATWNSATWNHAFPD